MAARVLFDLSIAGLGYSGIPQDTRCNFHALATETDFDVCGVVYTNLSDRTTFARIPGSTTPAWRKAWLQARYLEQLVNNSQPRSLSEYVGRKINVVERVALHAISKVRLSRLDNDMFFDVLWRNLLGKSLPASERERLATLTYYASNLSIEAIARKSYPWSRRFRLPRGLADVIITPDARPIRIRRGTVKISRYHDIIPVMAPDLIGDARRFMDRHMRCLHECVSNGDYFACNSQATEEHLCRLFPGLADRTFVAHCIVGGGLYPDTPEGSETRIRQIIQMRRSAAIDEIPAAEQPKEFARTMPAGRPLRYVLTVSALDPKKNHIAMLRAFLSANQQMGGVYRLIVVGSSGWNEQEILKAMRPMSDTGDVILLQSVPLAELRALYSAADVFLFPSLYEGFGLPPVEAMKCGTPVVASDIPALREVLGESAHYCNPYQVPSIADAIVEAIREPVAGRMKRTEAARRHAEAAYAPPRIADVWARNIRSILQSGRPCGS